MASFVARRAVYAVALLFVASLVVFLAMPLMQSTLRQDYQETRVLVLLMVCAVLVLNLLADIGLRMADPRIRGATALTWR